MKIQKAFLKNRMSKTLYNYPQNTKAGDKDFKISFSVSALEEENAEEFGGETLSSYHLLLKAGGNTITGTGEASRRNFWISIPVRRGRT